MNIDVIGRYSDVSPLNITDKNVAIIDVYRTTSVIVTALEHNAACIIPADSIEEAWGVFNKSKKDQTLLAGERKALPIKGFHLDNSPSSYSEKRVSGKNIILTTSNGTRAIKACRKCKNLYIASFLNVSSVADTLLQGDHDICIVCSGTLGTFSIEDGLCAGAIVSICRKKREVMISDLGWAMKRLYETESNIKELLKNGSFAYNYLLKTDYVDDIDYCLKIDQYNIVPVFDSRCIRA
jgi:2-phosphosulfolactate phosphatase